MRTDTRFSRPDRSELESRLPSGTLSDTHALGVWEYFLRSDDPSEVSHTYRMYRDSKNCPVPRQNLRAMRDVMITSMRESNRQDSTPRKEKKKGTHYFSDPDGRVSKRTSA